MTFYKLMPLVALFLSYCVHQTCSFAAKSSSLVAMRRRALARTSSSSVKQKRSNQKRQQTMANNHQHLSKSFILDVLDEAIFRQQNAIDSLDREAERKRAEELDNESAISNGLEKTEDPKSKSPNRDDSYSSIDVRRAELRDIEEKIHNLRITVEQSTTGKLDLEQIKQQIIDLGHGSIFRQPQSAWKSTKAKDKEFGRPQGFDGDIFYSPLGVPILVGRMNAHRDEVMRNAAQGSDLWFQVEDYNGSRVLLRTSLMRGTVGSKQCRQMAADLAAKLSVWGDEYDCVPVMYTDSRKVAKRGSKIGNMKKSKSLGRIMGYPRNVTRLFN